MPKHAAVVCWIANGTANIAAHFQTRQTCSQCRCATTGRPARRSAQIVRVTGGAIDLVIALEVSEMNWHVGFSENHCPGVLQTFTSHRITFGNIVFIRWITEGRRQADNVIRLLHRHRHAVQWPPVLAFRQCLIGGLGSCPRLSSCITTTALMSGLYFSTRAK